MKDRHRSSSPHLAAIRDEFKEHGDPQRTYQHHYPWMSAIEKEIATKEIIENMGLRIIQLEANQERLIDLLHKLVQTVQAHVTTPGVHGVGERIEELEAFSEVVWQVLESALGVTKRKLWDEGLPPRGGFA